MPDGTVHARCRHCSREADIPAYNIVNSRENPELKQQLLLGRIFIWTCPSCGTDNLVRYPLLYHDPDEKLLIWLSDGVKEVEDRMAQIRLVNRAKWAIIEQENLTEPQAHRRIEKLAMDRRVSKEQIAEDILRKYMP